MAHELGHVLLGSNSHSPNGIMCARWRVAELKLVDQQALGFLPFQKQLIRANAVAREQDMQKQARTLALTQR